MNSVVTQNGFFRLFRGDLIKLKLRALRSGAWFRVLRRAERVLVDLTIRVVYEVRSRVLAKALLSIMKKLEDASENRVSRAIRDFGFPCTRRLSWLAQKWGNGFAEAWAFDFSFARFIAIMHINTSGIARLL
ncbi:MAG TPA: hypothetical protein VMS94_00845 [Acidobacteriota bacterium]|nr:hypothetical protein [Acidobacteriota bacterium]